MQNNPYESPESNALDENMQTEKIDIFSMKQRIGRVRYLAYSTVSQLVLMLVFGMIFAIFGMSTGLISGTESPVGQGLSVFSIILFVLFYGVIIFVSVVLGIRRLHDLDKSGAWWLLLLVPFVNIGMAIYMLFFPGTKGPNKFGAKPEPNTVLTWIVGLVLPLIFVIGIIAAIALPAYQQYVERAKAASDYSETGY